MIRHRYNFFADPDAMERLRAHAEARGTTASDLIRTAILHYLEVLDAMPAPAGDEPSEADNQLSLSLL